MTLTRSTPLISAVIPVYNCERYIGRAVESVLGQTYQNIECIVVDDGSTDGTVAALAPFSERIRLIRQKNSGASSARNTGIEAANGEFIAFLDSDDYWISTKIEIQMQILIDHPELALVCCDFSWLSDTTNPAYIDSRHPKLNPDAIDLQDGLLDLLPNPYLGTPTVMVRSDVTKELGGFDTSLPVGEDLDFYFRVCTGRRFARLQQKLVYCQLRKGSLTSRPGGYPGTLEVLERVQRRNPDAGKQVHLLIKTQRREVYRRWARARIHQGNGSVARSVLASGRDDLGSLVYCTLYLKSYFSCPILKIRTLKSRLLELLRRSDR